MATGAAGLKRVIVTWSVVSPFAQGPLFSVHWNTFAPKPRPVTPVKGDAGLVIAPLPLMSTHCPVAGGIGLLPARVAELAHTCWSGPAFAAGLLGSYTVMFTVSRVKGGVHGPLLINQMKLFTPTPRPVIAVFRLVGFTIVALPDKSDHVPLLGWAFITVLLVGKQNC